MIHLVTVYGFLYDNPDDPQALLLQESIRKEGLSNVVERITGFPKTHELHRVILQQYETSKRRLESIPLVIVFAQSMRHKITSDR